MQFPAKHDTCYFGDIHNELPIVKVTVSQHIKELKTADFIKGEIETPKVKYCINKENRKPAQEFFSEFMGQCICRKRLLLQYLFFYGFNDSCFANYDYR